MLATEEARNSNEAKEDSKEVEETSVEAVTAAIALASCSAP